MRLSEYGTYLVDSPLFVMNSRALFTHDLWRTIKGSPEVYNKRIKHNGLLIGALSYKKLSNGHCYVFFYESGAEYSFNNPSFKEIEEVIKKEMVNRRKLNGNSK